MPEDDIQYKLRLPQELHRQLAELAKKNGRTLSSEIVARLQITLQWNLEGLVDLPGEQPTSIVSEPPNTSYFQSIRDQIESQRPSAAMRRKADELKAEEEARLEKLMASALQSAIQGEEVQQFFQSLIDRNTRLNKK